MAASTRIRKFLKTESFFLRFSLPSTRKRRFRATKTYFQKRSPERRYFDNASNKASLLTATRKLENIFPPPFPPLWLQFHLPDGRCALTFAGINLLVYLDFPSLICLDEINGHSCGQIYPKLELSLLGIPANRAHPKQDSTNSNN